MSSSHIAGSKRPREDTVVAPELTPAILAVLAASEVLHTGLEGAARSTLDDAVAVLPFSSSNTHRYLAAIALAGVAPPPFAATACSSVFFLAPMYPALRCLAMADAARAWVLVNMLCLDAPRCWRTTWCSGTRRTRQRKPTGGPPSPWTAAPRPTRCGSWSQASMRHCASSGGRRRHYPPRLGWFRVVHNALDAWRGSRACISMSVLNAFGGTTDAQLKLVGVLLAPTILAALRHQADVGVAASAFRVLEKLGSPELYLDGWITALGRLSSDSFVVTSVARVLSELSDTLEGCATLLAAGAAPPLVAALARYRDSDADIA